MSNLKRLFYIKLKRELHQNDEIKLEKYLLCTISQFRETSFKGRISIPEVSNKNMLVNIFHDRHRNIREYSQPNFLKHTMPLDKSNLAKLPPQYNHSYRSLISVEEAKNTKIVNNVAYNIPHTYLQRHIAINIQNGNR